MINDELLKKYQNTDYIIDDDPPLLVHIGEQNDGLRILFASFNVESAAFITAWNPGSVKLTMDENYDRQADLFEDISGQRLNYFVARGESAEDGWSEESYLVLGINHNEALKLAQKYGQNAFLWIPVSGVPELVDSTSS